MQKNSNATESSPNNTDSYLYASSVDGLLHDRNPIQRLIANTLHVVHTLLNLKKNKEAAQQNIQQIQAQLSRLEASIEAANPKADGQRLDRLR